MTEPATTPAAAEPGAPQLRLPDVSKLIVSSSPHLHDPRDLRRIMLLVMLALLPATLSGVFFFGWRALWVIGWCIGAAIAVEAGCNKLFRRPLSIGDGSAALTGLLLGLNLSASTPWWVCAIGAALAIGIAKQLYGGLGYNPFNPALVGRVGLLIAFPAILTTWVKTAPGQFLADAVTTATPLGQWKLGTLPLDQVSYGDFFLGNLPGCLGETSKAALLLGGLLLIALKLIRWQVPAAYLGTVALITGIAHAASPAKFASLEFHLLTGGLFLGAFFMATDMVTSPFTRLGGILFGAGCGVITCIIRLWCNYPEGVSFSILIMNALVPFIDRLCTTGTVFGARKAEAFA
ncbi:MAG: RnfABCDGE type electron transport complex subunit D [Lentisphaeria bacterium]|jgi:electron transport complex protein RnfD